MSPGVQAAAKRPAALTAWRETERGVEVEYDGHALAVTAIDAGIVRVRLGRHNEFARRRSWAVAAPDDTWPSVPVRVREEGGAVHVDTGLLDVVVGRERGSVDVRTHDGADVCVDGSTGGPSWDPDSSAAWWTKEAPPGRRFYGFGERTGLLEKGRRRYTCWTTDEWRQQGPTTDALYVAIPFLFGLDPDGRAHGLFLNNTFRTAFDLTGAESGSLVLQVDGGELEYYVVYGPEPARVVERFTAITGRTLLPPRWALGYHHSRWGYESAEEIRHVAREFRERRIPLDAIHLDIDHMDGYRSFTWDESHFPDPACLTRELGADGIRTLCVVDAGVKVDPDSGYAVYEEGRERGFFLRLSRDPGAPLFQRYVWPGLCAFPDFTVADVREWWGAHYRAYTNVGVAGFLNDMNEPAMHARPIDADETPNAEPPAALPHGGPEEPATHAEVRNVYANQENRAAFEFLRRERPEERPVLFTRAGFAGLQRYAGVWTGDISSTFEHLEMSLPQLVNLGLSGVSFAGADIGGFFENCDEELLVRWTQLGSLYPFARNHSARGTARQEPWMHGAAAEDACRRALELRYRLLPYLYTVFAEASASGAPVLRPLFWQDPGDPKTHSIADQALIGSALLVAPVVRPGKEAREVYFPKGLWTDLRSRKQHEGPGSALVEAPLYGEIPLFARGGSIVPFGPSAQWADERPLDPLTLEVFPDEGGSAGGELYEDDGRSRAHLDGAWARTAFSYADGRLTSIRTGAFAPPSRSVTAVVTKATGVEATVLPDVGNWEALLP